MRTNRENDVTETVFHERMALDSDAAKGIVKVPFALCGNPECGKSMAQPKCGPWVLPCGHVLCAMCLKEAFPDTSVMRFGFDCPLCKRFVPFDGRYDSESSIAAFISRRKPTKMIFDELGKVGIDPTAPVKDVQRDKERRFSTLVSLTKKLIGARADAQKLLERTEQALNGFDTAVKTNEVGQMLPGRTWRDGVNGFFDMLTGQVSRNKAETMESLNALNRDEGKRLAHLADELRTAGSDVAYGRVCLERALPADEALRERALTPLAERCRMVVQHCDDIVGRPQAGGCGLFWPALKGGSKEQLLQEIREQFDKFPKVTHLANARISKVEMARAPQPERMYVTIELPMTLEELSRDQSLTLYLHGEDTTNQRSNTNIHSSFNHYQARQHVERGRGAERTITLDFARSILDLSLSCEIVRTKPASGSSPASKTSSGRSLVWRVHVKQADRSYF